MYIDGNVVSETSRKYITNMLVATASAKIDDPFNSSDESDEEQWKDCTSAAANMQLVQRTLNGISARNTEDGQRAFGRHASTIRMGRALWQTPPLLPHEQQGIEETFFDDGSLPPLKESKAAFDAAKKKDKSDQLLLKARQSHIFICQQKRMARDWKIGLLLCVQKK